MKRPTWSSQVAFVLAAIGSAVGLGNIWRFPYIMGQNGGAVFLVTYLILIFCICCVPLFAELIFGKVTKKSVLGAYEEINPKLEIFGWSNVLTSVVVASFYFVVGGWIIFYVMKSFFIGNVSDFGVYFSNFTALPVTSVLCTLTFLTICIFFVYRGVNKGIELANKIMMPLFAVLLLSLVCVSLSLPNAKAGLDFMFSPDFSKINFHMLLSALGQALFTLSIGVGTILTYGSYLKKEDSVFRSGYTIVVADTIFAILAGIMIFPAVFSFGLEPNSGPGLVFITLPKIFAQLPFGEIVSFGFFALLLFAALTSGISMVEVTVSALIEKFKISRAKSALITLLIVGIITTPVTLSFGLLKNITFHGMTLFDMFDFTTANILMPLNSMFVCLVVGWLLDTANENVFKNKIMQKFFILQMKFLLPILFIILMIEGLKG